MSTEAPATQDRGRAALYLTVGAVVLMAMLLGTAALLPEVAELGRAARDALDPNQGQPGFIMAIAFCLVLAFVMTQIMWEVRPKPRSVASFALWAGVVGALAPSAAATLYGYAYPNGPFMQLGAVALIAAAALGLLWAAATERTTAPPPHTNAAEPMNHAAAADSQRTGHGGSWRRETHD